MMPGHTGFFYTEFTIPADATEDEKQAIFDHQHAKLGQQIGQRTSDGRHYIIRQVRDKPDIEGNVEHHSISLVILVSHPDRAEVGEFTWINSTAQIVPGQITELNGKRFQRKTIGWKRIE